MKIYTNAYLDRNLGDDLMLRLAAKAMPMHTFCVPFSNRTLLYPFADLKNIEGGAPPLDKNINPDRFDALLTIGGSMYITGTRKSIWQRYKTFYRGVGRFSRAKKPIAVCGCNLGLAVGRLGQLVVNREISKAGSVTVRDALSHEILNNAGIKSGLFPDMLFSVEMPKVQNRLGLGISVYRDVRTPSRNYDYYQTMAKIADGYIAATGKPVFIFAFDCEGENDLCAAYTIISMMKSEQKPEIVAYTGQYMPVLQRLASCEAFIATRFHSLVFALTSQTPVLPVIYSKKTSSLLDDMGYDGLRLDFEGIDGQTDEICRLVSSPNQMFCLDRKAIDGLREKSCGHINTLTQYFNN